MREFRSTTLGGILHVKDNGIIKVDLSKGNDVLTCAKCGKSWKVTPTLEALPEGEGYCCGQLTKGGTCVVCGSKL